jgi:hypothetical protein
VIEKYWSNRLFLGISQDEITDSWLWKIISYFRKATSNVDCCIAVEMIDD